MKEGNGMEEKTRRKCHMSIILILLLELFLHSCQSHKVLLDIFLQILLHQIENIPLPLTYLNEGRIMF